MSPLHRGLAAAGGVLSGEGRRRAEAAPVTTNRLVEPYRINQANPALGAGVVVLVPVLVGRTCVQLRHKTSPSSARPLSPPS
jgi:hypothetical protein